jgi:adenosylhomocysteine nucleosidase
MQGAPIIIQGATDGEIDGYLSRIGCPEAKEVDGFLFYRGRFCGKDLIVCKTEIGIINAAAATAAGILTFHPRAVINQGTAGAHIPQLHIGDIVVGKECVNINDLKMPARGSGEGSDPLKWEFSKRSVRRRADPDLLKLFERAEYPGYRKVSGILGSGDLFSREADRIAWIHQNRNNLCEDMESISAYEVCGRFSVPCIGLRVISNNELTGEKYEASSAGLLQRFVTDALSNPAE